MSKFGKKTKQSYVCVSEHAKTNFLTVMTDKKKIKGIKISFLRFLLFLGLNFPKRKRCFSFWFSDVYSQMPFVNICLKYILDKIYFF